MLGYNTAYVNVGDAIERQRATSKEDINPVVSNRRATIAKSSSLGIHNDHEPRYDDKRCHTYYLSLSLSLSFSSSSHLFLHLLPSSYPRS